MKKLKMNWGAGIAAAYAGFVLMIASLVGMSASQKIDLATDKYYDEELQFQEKIDKTRRALALHEPLTWIIENDRLIIHFPKIFDDQILVGKLKFYCPANNLNDRTFELRSADHTQIIALKNIPAGRYNLQFDWAAAHLTFWNEGTTQITH